MCVCVCVLYRAVMVMLKHRWVGSVTVSVIVATLLFGSACGTETVDVVSTETQSGVVRSFVPDADTADLVMIAGSLPGRPTPSTKVELFDGGFVASGLVAPDGRIRSVRVENLGIVVSNLGRLTDQPLGAASDRKGRSEVELPVNDLVQFSAGSVFQSGANGAKGVKISGVGENSGSVEQLGYEFQEVKALVRSIALVPKDAAKHWAAGEQVDLVNVVELDGVRWRRTLTGSVFGSAINGPGLSIRYDLDTSELPAGVKAYGSESVSGGWKGSGVDEATRLSSGLSSYIMGADWEVTDGATRILDPMTATQLVITKTSARLTVRIGGGEIKEISPLAAELEPEQIADLEARQ